MTRVFILYTGGTIGMAPGEPDKPGSPLAPQSLDELKRYFPGLAHNPDLQLEFRSFETPLDSSNLGPEHWVEMARVVESVYDSHDGFVILHGTDTMAYTSSALAFMFENLAKPVVITGSQLPISDIRTDAIQNLVNSVQVAGYQAFGLPCIPEVVIVFADRIVRGCRARKVSATSWAGFDSPNFPLLGRIGEQIRIDTRLLRPLPVEGQRFGISTALDSRVIDIGLTPTLQAAHLRRLLLSGSSDVQAILLRTYGAGDAPNRQDFLDVISEVSEKQKVVLNVSQCLEGTVEMGLYAASAGLVERGVISALDMTPEAALTKLMWTLGSQAGVRVTTQMQVNLRGEQSHNLFNLGYGSCVAREKFERSARPDQRFAATSLEKVAVRFSGLAFPAGVPIGGVVALNVFLNSNQGRMATSTVTWTGEPQSLTIVLDEEKCKLVMTPGDIMLCVEPAQGGVQLSFAGLHLALLCSELQ